MVERIPFSYRDRQFVNRDDYLDDVRELVISSDFTLGKSVAEFERRFAAMCGMLYALGVESGMEHADVFA